MSALLMRCGAKRWTTMMLHLLHTVQGILACLGFSADPTAAALIVQYNPRGVWDTIG